MEESIEWEFDSCMTEMFGLGEVDVNQYSPLTLAYIGDSIYDLIIKTLVGTSRCKSFIKGRAVSCRLLRSLR